MKMFCLLAFIAWSFSSLPGFVHAEDTPRPAKPMMKGMELYSWPDEKAGNWMFSLLPGTNVRKSATQIKDPKNTISSLTDLGARFARLAAGESVIWNSGVDPKIFPLPPPDVVRLIIGYGKSKQINVRVSGK